jgi:predicted Zn-dependent protease
MKKKISVIVIILLGFSFISLATSANVYKLTMSGGKLKPQEADKLEQQLAKHPRNIDLRTKLLGYYWRKRSDSASQQAKYKHILWLIKNAPEAEVLAIPYGQLNKVFAPQAYPKAKKLWLEQLKNQPTNLKILNNAAAFFKMFDRNLAEKFLKKAQSQDSENPKWAKKLGQLYLLGIMGKSPEDKTEAAIKSLEQYEIAYKLSSKQDRTIFLQYLAKAAVAAGQPKKATKYAQEMLDNNPKDWNYGNNIHHANIILGEIAFEQGDIDAAKQYLIKAGKTPGSPQLNSFGPSMKLAKQLLQQGERDTVLEYFKLCGKFWKFRGKKKLNAWIVAVKAGKEPDWGIHSFR